MAKKKQLKDVIAKALAENAAKPKGKRRKTIEFEGDFYYIESGEKITNKSTISVLKNQNKKQTFKPGESGNAAGRPAGRKTRATVLNNFLKADLKNPIGKNMKNPFTGDDSMTVEEAIMAALIKKALSGDVRAIQEIQDTAYGKIKDVQQIINGANLEISDDMTPKQAADLYMQIINDEVVLADDE